MALNIIRRYNGGHTFSVGAGDAEPFFLDRRNGSGLFLLKPRVPTI